MIKLLSQLTHVEIYATDIEASVKFYEEQIGMRVVDRIGDKVYLRCWGDYYPYSLVLTPNSEAGLEAMAWRTTSEEALVEAVRRIEETEYAGHWIEPGASLGRSYLFTGPYGHTMQLFWEVERYWGEGEFKSKYPDRPSRRTGHGLAPRFLDHVTIASPDIKGFANWYSDTLGFRIMGYAGLDDLPVTFFGVITTNEKSHDLGILLDTSDRAGRIHHYAFWVDTREELFRAADLLIENGTPMEYGPGLHGLGEQDFLYFRDPSGLRIEVNTGGYRNYVPDWQPYDWKVSQGNDDMFLNTTLPKSMLEASPPANGVTSTEQGLVPGSEAELIAQAALHVPKV